MLEYYVVMLEYYEFYWLIWCFLFWGVSSWLDTNSCPREILAGFRNVDMVIVLLTAHKQNNFPVIWLHDKHGFVTYRMNSNIYTEHLFLSSCTFVLWFSLLDS